MRVGLKTLIGLWHHPDDDRYVDDAGDDEDAVMTCLVRCAI